MALVLLGKSRCAICEKILVDGDRMVSTSHFITDQTDPFWRYSDAPFHYLCFLKWKSRHRFICRFNELAAKTPLSGGNVQYMSWDGEMFSGTDYEVREARTNSIYIVLDELWIRSGCASLKDLLEPDPKGEKNKEFQEYWEELTRPEHLEVLEGRVAREFEPMAREWSERALEDCRRRCR
jgi:hypothetical protein